jgi:phospholipase/carboxylesterase
MATPALQSIDGSALRFAVAGERHNPRSLVLLLHGSGSHGSQLLPVAEHLATILPGTLFVMPSAPHSVGASLSWMQKFITKLLVPQINLEESRTWVTGELTGDNREKHRQLLEALRSPIRALSELVDLLLARHRLSDGALGIYGFSQGGMMAAYLGLYRSGPCAGMICHSGQFYGGAEGNSRPRALVIVGAKELDPSHPQHHVFPLTVRKLRELSVPVDEMVVDGLAHGINKAVVERCAAFLRDGLGAAGPPPAPATPASEEPKPAP